MSGDRQRAEHRLALSLRCPCAAGVAVKEAFENLAAWIAGQGVYEEHVARNLEPRQPDFDVVFDVLLGERHAGPHHDVAAQPLSI
jgi:hypothetical protein